MNTFLDWFRSHDPFDGNVPQLRSQRSLDSVSVRNATIKRRQMVHTLNELKSGVKVPRWISNCTDRPFGPVPVL